MGANEPCHDTSVQSSASKTMESSLDAQKKILGDDGMVPVSLDMRQFSDKVPLTDFHLCKTEDCHGSKGPHSESPLEPFKTRTLYVILLLILFWLPTYFLLLKFHII